MKYAALILLGLVAWSVGYTEDEVPAHPHIRMETTEGTFILELEGRRAPITVKNFLSLVDSGYFNGTIFHRVIPDFMVQGGGYMLGPSEKGFDNTIPNESGNGLSNVYGTIAMARTSDPHSAAAQFFINVADNSRLDPSPESWGYAVFGYVIEGMDVVDRISEVPTGPGGKFKSDVPVAPIIIEKASRVVYDQ